MPTTPATPLPDLTAPEADAAPEYYYVRTPYPINDTRYGQKFDEGVLVLPAGATWSTPTPGAPDVVRPLLDLFREDLGYEVEPVPPGVPPLHPRLLGQLKAQPGGTP